MIIMKSLLILLVMSTRLKAGVVERKPADEGLKMSPLEFLGEFSSLFDNQWWNTGNQKENVKEVKKSKSDLLLDDEIKAILDDVRSLDENNLAHSNANKEESHDHVNQRNKIKTGGNIKPNTDTTEMPIFSLTPDYNTLLHARDFNVFESVSNNKEPSFSSEVKEKIDDFEAVVDDEQTTGFQANKDHDSAIQYNNNPEDIPNHVQHSSVILQPLPVVARPIEPSYMNHHQVGYHQPRPVFIVPQAIHPQGSIYIGHPQQPIVNEPVRVFLDPSSDKYMTSSTTDNENKGEDDEMPTARSYNRKEEITMETLLQEKASIDKGLNKKLKPPRHTEIDILSVSKPESRNGLLEEDLYEIEEGIEAPYDTDLLPELDETILCQTENDLFGTCESVSECAMVSGIPAGHCEVPSIVGLQSCCLHTIQCYEQSTQLVAYITNYEYPQPTTKLPECPMSLAIMPGICQVRIDILHMSFWSQNGQCSPFNSMIISSSPSGSVAHQPLCGFSSSLDPLEADIPHVYVHFNHSESAYPFPFHQLNFDVSIYNYPSSWNLRLSQIRCDIESHDLVPLKADSSCSQWFTGTSGIIENSYLLGGSYGKAFKSCIKPRTSACSVKYHIHSVQCVYKDQIQIIGSENVDVCSVSSKEWEIIVPKEGSLIGIVAHPSEQDFGALSYKIGYTLVDDC